MPICIEYAPELVLRNFSEYENKRREKEECVPENLKKNEIYNFLKQGQKAYWLEGEQALLEKYKDGSLSKPIASIQILEVVHFVKDGQLFSKGKYKVIRLISKGEIYFNGCEPVNCSHL